MFENTAIICETNPFHNGHDFLFSSVKQRDHGIVTAVMSGNFVQRGIPAVFDKYYRASVLLAHGADLVVELPYPWSAAGGEAFAAGGVAVANGMGADSLAFGSETGDKDMLSACAAYLESREYSEKMHKLEKEEAEIGAAVLHDRLCREAGFILGSNDKLAVWYLRQIRARQANMIPLPYRRIAQCENIASAAALRQMLDRGEDISGYIPADVSEAYRTRSYVSEDRFAVLAWIYFRLFAPECEGKGADTSGLYRRLVKTAGKCTDGRDFFACAATKKYTDARVRRTALMAMTDAPNPDKAGLPVYTVLLAAGEKGRAYLKKRRKDNDFPILTKPADVEKLSIEARLQYQWQIRADRLYTMCMEPAEERDTFLRRHPVIG